MILTHTDATRPRIRGLGGIGSISQILIKKVEVLYIVELTISGMFVLCVWKVNMYKIKKYS